MVPDPIIECRMSTRRSLSNPILQSELAYARGVTLRDKESRRLACLEELQQHQVPLHRIPRFEKVDATSLVKSNERIGVVGLLVDTNRVGLVTKIRVLQNITWKISPNLPFRQQHIQLLIHQLILESHLDFGLPELLSFEIDDTLGERYEGDSMDIACLLAIIDCLAGCKTQVLGSAVAVVSPSMENILRPSGFITEKLSAFCREFDRGTLLVRSADCDEARCFDKFFDEVWQVDNLDQLAYRLGEHDLLSPLLNKVTLKHHHANPVSNFLTELLAREEKLMEAERFLERLKQRVNQETPPLMRYEILSVEQDLHRHLGNFDQAIEVRSERKKLEQIPYITSYQRMIESDTRFAAALYDAHRFSEAAEIMMGCRSLIEAKGELICSAEIRSYMLNTLARSLTLLGKGGWEQYFRESMSIQEHISPVDIPRTRNFLIHSFLKNKLVSEAVAEFRYVTIGSNPYSIWLEAELTRQLGLTWDMHEKTQLSTISKVEHVYGFICQAVARQLERSLEQRIELLREAQVCFEHGTDPAKPNIKSLLAAACALGVAVTLQDLNAVREAICSVRSFLNHPRCDSHKGWYQAAIDRVAQDPTWENVDQFFCRIPLF
jgi:hypothetical protein